LRVQWETGRKQGRDEGESLVKKHGKHGGVMAVGRSKKHLKQDRGSSLKRTFRGRSRRSGPDTRRLGGELWGTINKKKGQNKQAGVRRPGGVKGHTVENLLVGLKEKVRGGVRKKGPVREPTHGNENCETVLSFNYGGGVKNFGGMKKKLGVYRGKKRGKKSFQRTQKDEWGDRAAKTTGAALKRAPV